MKLLLIFATALLLLTALTVHAHPSRPLNERSTELAWQAWLLVDENQRQPAAANLSPGGDGLNAPALRRRITPKSIFITPTFSPERLQPCADGYESDQMGRCMKIIKLDEDAHLEYLLQKLNAQFGVGLVVDVDETLPTPGPMKFEISLDLDDQQQESKSSTTTTTTTTTTEKVEELSQSNGGVAVVVAPTNGNFDLSRNSTVIKKSPSPSSTESSGTTLEDLVTTLEETTTTTDSSEEVTTLEPQALFFRDPSKDLTTADHGTQVKYEDVIIIGNRMREPEESTDFVPQSESIKPLSEDADSRFETTTNNDATTTTTLLASASGLNMQIRFPGDAPPQKVNIEDSNFETLFSEYINNRGPDLTSNERHIFRNRLPPGSDSSEPPHRNNNNNNNNRLYNHRNRDKHHVTWQFPSPHWTSSTTTTSSPVKSAVSPVVRFDRQHNSYNQVQPGRVDNHRQYFRSNVEPPAVYREVPRKELSYIFGFKRALTNR